MIVAERLEAPYRSYKSAEKKRLSISQRLARTSLAFATLFSAVAPFARESPQQSSHGPAYDASCVYPPEDRLIQNHGLPSIRNGRLFNIYLNWDTDNGPVAEMNSFTHDMTQGFFDPFKEVYGIESVTFAGYKSVPFKYSELAPSEWPNVVEEIIKQNPDIPQPASDLIYNVYLPPSAKNRNDPCVDGRSSFHWHKDRRILFSVIVANGADWRWVEAVISHEDLEALVNRYGTLEGWVTSGRGEPGDYCGKAGDYGPNARYQVSLILLPNGQCVAGLFRGDSKKGP